MLAEKIKAIECHYGISAKKLAEISDVAFATLYRLDGSYQADSALTEKVLIKFCQNTGISFEWLTDFSKKGMKRNKNGELEIKFDDESKLTAHIQTGVGERIKEIRTENSLSQEQLGEILGITRQMVSQIENEKSKLTNPIAEKIEKHLGYGTEWLMTGNERNKECPVGEEMVEWLKEHPEMRKQVWKKMKQMKE